MKRKFKGIGLRENPAPEYDAVIIGAGVGGLMTGNLLAQQGMKVLLVEQHYVVGGYCSAFNRKRFQFDAASHFYPLLGNTESMTGKLLKQLEIPTEWEKMDPVDHFNFPDGTKYSVPASFDQYMADLKRMFPEERENLDAFFKEVNTLYLLGLLVYFRGRPTNRIDPYKHQTLRDALDRHFTSKKLKLLLTADCPHWGSPPRRISYVFDSMLRLSYFLGNYYPKGGSQAFADDLAARFEQQGGDIILRADVRRIIVKKDRARGIEIEHGPEKNRRRTIVGSPIVVSNADISQTASRLLGPELVGKEYLDNLKSFRTSYPCYLMHIGLNDTREEELYDAQGYHWRHWDPEEFGTTGLKFKFFVPTIFDKTIAPKGSQIVIIQKAMHVDYDKVEDWNEHKAEVDRMVIENLEQMIPRFHERVAVRMSASARTSYRYTWNQSGAMLGWEMAPDQLGGDRPGTKGPFEGLYYTGHWTQPGGGITPVIVSAMRVAEAVTNTSLI
ncbi:MAG: phytoene dehydrogenase-like protein [Verrucomicrobiales bacterium]|jgi:phytoene dehydrogenase-like protein